MILGSMAYCFFINESVLRWRGRLSFRVCKKISSQSTESDRTSWLLPKETLLELGSKCSVSKSIMVTVSALLTPECRPYGICSTWAIIITAMHWVSFFWTTKYILLARFGVTEANLTKYEIQLGWVLAVSPPKTMERCLFWSVRTREWWKSSPFERRFGGILLQAERGVEVSWRGSTNLAWVNNWRGSTVCTTDTCPGLI